MCIRDSVNTDDATYVSSKKSADNIKQIMKDNMETYEAFFDYNRTTYKEWGMQEILNYSQGYKVRKLTIFPGMSMTLHQHEKRTEHWSIVEGVATITVGNETADYNKYESVFIPVGAKHKIANKTDKNVVVIEVGIGDNISDNDLVKIYNQEMCIRDRYKELADAESKVIFGGRLGEYKYYDMDAVVAAALDCAANNI